MDEGDRGDYRRDEQGSLHGRPGSYLGNQGRCNGRRFMVFCERDSQVVYRVYQRNLQALGTLQYVCCSIQRKEGNFDSAQRYWLIGVCGEGGGGGSTRMM